MAAKHSRRHLLAASRLLVLPWDCRRPRVTNINRDGQPAKLLEDRLGRVVNIEADASCRSLCSISLSAGDPIGRATESITCRAEILPRD
jgi:hypothetical protein